MTKHNKEIAVWCIAYLFLCNTRYKRYRVSPKKETLSITIWSIN